MHKEENQIFGCQYNLLDGEQFTDTDLKKIFSTILNDNNICVKLFNNNNVKYIVYNDKKIQINKIDDSQKKKELATTKCSGVFWQFINKNNKIFNKKLYDKMYKQILYNIKNPNKNIDKIYRIETKKFTPLLFAP